jgi:hypothetical protein
VSDEVNRLLRAAAGRGEVTPASSEPAEERREQRIRELQQVRREHGSLFPWEREELRSLSSERGSADGGRGHDRQATLRAEENDINAQIRRASGRTWA